MSVTRLHATCIAIEGFGALFRGPSGAGKSDLALRLIDGGAQLVADDQVLLRRQGDILLAEPPAALAGRIEVRGLGIVVLPWRAPVRLAVLFDLGGTAPIRRLPEPETVCIGGLEFPLHRLAPFEASAPAKVRIALSLACTHIKDHEHERDPAPNGRTGTLS